MHAADSIPGPDELLEVVPRYLLDLSTVIWWASLEQPHEIAPGAEFLVPAAFTELLAEYRDPPDWFLDLHVRYTTARFFAPRANIDFRQLWPYLRELLQRGVIRGIPETEDESAAEAALRQALRASRRNNSLRQQDAVADLFIERYLTAMLQFSLRTRTPILMKARTLPQLLRERVTVLELANSLDVLIDRKQALTSRLFGRGRLGRRRKLFVGVVVSVAGIGSPWASALGVLLAFMDP